MSKSNNVMIVKYKKPNILSLPYVEGKGKESNTKYFKFKPGVNKIAPAVFDSIVENVKDRAGKNATEEERQAKWDHYERHLQIEAEEKTRKGGLVDLNIDEFIDIIKNTFSLEELKNYRELEEGKTEGNVSRDVIKAIKAQITKVKKAEKTVQDKHDEKND